jgi:proteasome lid subunit RPN8/RPN11
MMRRALHLSAADWRTMVDHLEACLPEEGCGLLAGRGDEVVAVLPIENSDHSPTHYHMEDRALVGAFQRLEAMGLDLLAAFHSHPSGPLGVSQDDRREWQYPEAALVICVPRAGTWEARAYLLADGDPREILLAVAPGGPGEGSPSQVTRP